MELALTIFLLPYFSLRVLEPPKGWMRWSMWEDCGNGRISRTCHYPSIIHPSIHPSIYLSLYLSTGPPNRGGRRHQGTSPFRRCLAVVVQKLSIALATRGRASAADPPLKSFTLLGFSRFWGFGVGKKMVKFEDAFLEVLKSEKNAALTHFLNDFTLFGSNKML